MYYSDHPAELARLRQSPRPTRGDWARLARLTPGTYSSIVSGKKEITVRILRRMREYYGVSSDAILDWRPGRIIQ